MDVIAEIKKFELHPDRAHFSHLQVNDFYEKLVGSKLKFEAIITAIRKGTNSDYEIYADTYAYTILHNPVTARDYLNWAPDMHFCCEADSTCFRFNPLTDLIKGDRFHCSAVFLRLEDNIARVKLNSFDKVPFLEIEKEKELLEKKFNSAYEEMTVFAPKRQFRKSTFDKTLTFSATGALMGGLLGLFWACVESLFEPETSIVIMGVEGAMMGGLLLGFVGLMMSFLRPARRLP